MLENNVGNLIGRLRANDRDAVTELIDRYGEQIRRHIRIELSRFGRHRRCTSDTEFNSTVESIFHSVLIKFLERVHDGPFEQEEAMQLLPYIKRMVNNRLYDRRRSRGHVQAGDGNLLDAAAGREKPPHEAVANKELLTRMRASLTQEEQQVLDLWGQGKNCAQIAAELRGGTPGKYRAKRSRIITYLRRRWNSDGENHA